jgi:hypothetical protein
MIMSVADTEKTMATTVNWIDDAAGLSVIESLGLAYETRSIQIGTIDKKESAQNRARETPLDKERSHGIARAMKQNVPMPRLVFRARKKDNKVKFVVAGGNHRLYAISEIIREDEAVEAHIVDCSNEEFELLCRLLNTVVGEGSSVAVRIAQATDAVDRLGFPINKAAEMYHISRNDLKKAIQSRDIRTKFELTGKKVSASQINSIGMKCIDNDNVLKAMLPVIAKHGLTRAQVRDMSKRCEEHKTESDMIHAVATYDAEMEKTKERPTPRPRRTNFLRLLTSIEASFVGASSAKTLLEFLQFSDEESEEVRQRCKKIANTLSCL